jgi:hypothetical protein
VISKLTRLDGETWLDALLFQATEATPKTEKGVLTTMSLLDCAESNYDHYRSCGEDPQSAADIVSHEMGLPARSIR